MKWLKSLLTDKREDNSEAYSKTADEIKPKPYSKNNIKDIGYQQGSKDRKDKNN